MKHFIQTLTLLGLFTGSFFLSSHALANESLFVSCQGTTQDRAACDTLEQAFLRAADVDAVLPSDLALTESVSAEPSASSPCVSKPSGSACTAWLADEGVYFKAQIRGRKRNLMVELIAVKTGETLLHQEKNDALHSLDDASLNALAHDVVNEMVSQLAPAAQAKPGTESSTQGEPVLARRAIRYSWLPLGLTLASGITAALVSAEAAHLEDKFQSLVKKAKTEAQSAKSVKDAKSKADDHALAANVMWGVTGALAAVTVTSFCLEYFLTPDDPVQGRRVVLAPAVTQDQASVQLLARF